MIKKLGLEAVRTDYSVWSLSTVIAYDFTESETAQFTRALGVMEPVLV